MPRNLDHRIEIVAPVEDARAQQRHGAGVRRPARGQRDCAWELGSEGNWMKLRPRKGDRGRAAQQVFMRSAKARARRRAAGGRPP
jgi:polyphosphate kinase